MDLEREVRKVERCLGIRIDIRNGESGRPEALCADDSKSSGGLFATLLGPPSRWKEHIKNFHESIYRARSRRKYELQNGLCAHCRRDMRGRGQCDHDIPRARGRDDRLSNLNIYCAPFSGGCNFHAEKHAG